MRPDFTSLKLFLTVVEERSIGKAAEREHISAAAVSKRMSDLESLMGVTLLSRRSTGVKVTAAGSALADEVREILHSLDRMKGKLSAYTSGELGEIRIWFSSSGLLGSLPADLNAYMAKHPMVDLHLEEYRAVEVVKGVLRGDADMGIFARNDATKELMSRKGINTFPYETLRFVVVARSDHPLSKRESVNFSEVATRHCIGFSDASPIGALMRRVCARGGIDFHSRVTVANFDAARKMIQSGLGIGVLPELSVRPYAEMMNLKCIELKDEWAVYRLDICTRASETLTLPVQLMLSQLLKHTKADGARPTQDA